MQLPGGLLTLELRKGLIAYFHWLFSICSFVEHKIAMDIKGFIGRNQRLNFNSVTADNNYVYCFDKSAPVIVNQTVS